MTELKTRPLPPFTYDFSGCFPLCGEGGLLLCSGVVSVAKLTDKQKRFVDEYLVDLNATAAAKRAGYKSSIASQTYDKIKLSYENKDTGKREIFVAQDSSNINQWGVLQYYEKLDSTTNAKAMADALLSLYNTKTRTLKLQDVLGDIRVRAGTLLVVMLGLGDINVSNYLMVEQVKHTFNNEQHLMELKMRGGTFVT